MPQPDGARPATRTGASPRLALLLAALLLCPSPRAQTVPAQAEPLRASLPPAPSWEGQVIYQVMPDRFFDGDPANDAPTSSGAVDRSDPGAWHGGDLAGLTQQLGYIQQLGATAVWTTPIYPQVPPYRGTAGYHGYWPADFRAVDPHLGTLADYGAFVKAAHGRGMRVMLDQVTNHFGYGAGAVTQHPEWFHTAAQCAAAPAAGKMSVCPLAGLPDLDQSVPAVADLLAGNADFWRAQGVDGFRYDAIANVDPAFLAAQMARDRQAGTYTLGEWYGADADRVAEEQRLGVDSLFEFSLQAALKASIMGGQGFGTLRAVLAQDAGVPRPGEVALFLDNHDLPRFASGSLFEDVGQARTAYGLRALMTLKGIPVLWQGTEDAQRGGPDPDNRRDMRFPAAWTAGERAVYDAARDAIAVRRASPALSRGDQTLLPLPDSVSDTLLAFTRSLSKQTVLVAWNNAPSRRTYSVRSALPGQALTPSLFREPGGAVQHAGLSVSGGYLHLSLPARSAAAFVLNPAR